ALPSENVMPGLIVSVQVVNVSSGVNDSARTGTGAAASESYATNAPYSANARSPSDPAEPGNLIGSSVPISLNCKMVASPPAIGVPGSSTPPVPPGALDPPSSPPHAAAMSAMRPAANIALSQGLRRGLSAVNSFALLIPGWSAGVTPRGNG